MDGLTLAFGAMGAASIGVLVVHAIAHRRRVRRYRKLLTGDEGFAASREEASGS